MKSHFCLLLPFEITAYIVDKLATPTSCRYYHDADVLVALLQLCLTSRTLYGIALPHLYSSIRVTPEQLSLLCRTLASLPHLTQHIRSLSLPDPFGGFEYLSPPSSTDLLTVLALVRPFIRCMIFDRALRCFDWMPDDYDLKWSLRQVMAQFEHLEEFTSIHCELFLSDRDRFPNDPGYVCWPAWTSLRRLSLHNPMIDDEFVGAIRGLINLTYLALDSPDFDDDQPSPILLQHPGLQRMLFISWEREQTVFGGYEGQHMKDMMCATRRGLEVAVIKPNYMDSSQQSPQSWMREHIEDGSLWELEGIRLSPHE